MFPSLLAPKTLIVVLVNLQALACAAETREKLMQMAHDMKIELYTVQLQSEPMASRQTYYVLQESPNQQSNDYQVWKHSACARTIKKSDLIFLNTTQRDALQKSMSQYVLIYQGCPKDHVCTNGDCFTEAKISKHTFDPAPMLIIVGCFVMVGAIVCGVECSRRRKKAKNPTQKERVRAYITTAAERAALEAMNSNGELRFELTPTPTANGPTFDGSFTALQSSSTPHRSQILVPKDPQADTTRSVSSDKYYVTARPLLEKGVSFQEME